LADISLAIPFSNAGGSGSFVRKGFEDPEEPTVLAGGAGGLEDDEEFDITAGCCLELRGANLEVSVVFLSISLLMIKRLLLLLVSF